MLRLCAAAASILNITEIFLYFDGIKYSFSNFLRAVDICYKTMYVFDLAFPPESVTFWTFTDNFFFDVKCNETSTKVHIMADALSQVFNKE